MRFRREISPSPRGQTIYQGILGTEIFPKTPQDTPKKFFLQGDLLSALEDSIFDPRHKEHRYTISWDKKSGHFVVGRVETGGEDRMPELSLMDQLIILTREKAIMRVHNHPENPGKEWPHSENDVALAKAWPRLAFMYIVGSRYGVAAIVQTEASTSGSLLLSRKKGSEVLDRLSIKEFSSTRDQIERALMLEREGYAYYLWYPLSGILQKGDLEDGITLTKVTQKGIK